MTSNSFETAHRCCKCGSIEVEHVFKALAIVSDANEDDIMLCTRLKPEYDKHSRLWWATSSTGGSYCFEKLENDAVYFHVLNGEWVGYLKDGTVHLEDGEKISGKRHIAWEGWMPTSVQPDNLDDDDPYQALEADMRYVRAQIREEKP